jgi:hypothetical protein
MLAGFPSDIRLLTAFMRGYGRVEPVALVAPNKLNGRKPAS